MKINDKNLFGILNNPLRDIYCLKALENSVHKDKFVKLHDIQIVWN